MDLQQVRNFELVAKKASTLPGAVRSEAQLTGTCDHWAPPRRSIGFLNETTIVAATVVRDNAVPLRNFTYANAIYRVAEQNEPAVGVAVYVAEIFVRVEAEFAGIDGVAVLAATGRPDPVEDGNDDAEAGDFVNFILLLFWSTTC
jgi:hypothetical protein